MKKIIYLLIILTTCSLYSQVDRTIGRSQYKNSNLSSKEKTDPVERTLLYLKESLSLDGFQEAAIKIYLTEHYTESEKINNILTNPEEKKIKFDELKKTFDEKTKGILRPDQIEKFTKLAEDAGGSKKKKKKKEEEN